MPNNPLDVALLAILDSAIAASHVQCGNIQVRVPDTNALRIAVERGFKLPFLEFFAWVLNADDCACGAAFGNAERTIVEDVRSSSVFGDAARHVLLAAGVQSVQSTPIVVKENGEVVGVLSTHYRTRYRPSRAQLAQVDVLASRAATLLHPFSAPVTAASMPRATNVFQSGSVKRDRVRK